jgi:REP element-mobilizing transposase RayT
MKFDPQIHHRQSLRWRGYDYASEGAYFLTICTQGRICLLSKIEKGIILPGEIGGMIESAWLDLPLRFPTIGLDYYAIMPNHFHGIIFLNDSGADTRPAPTSNSGADTRPAPTSNSGADTRPAPTSNSGADTRPTPTLGDIVCAFKSLTTREYARGVRESGWPMFEKRLWQRNYYEHVIRNEDELNRIREYVIENPANWDQDEENPANW